MGVLGYIIYPRFGFWGKTFKYVSPRGVFSRGLMGVQKGYTPPI